MSENTSAASNVRPITSAPAAPEQRGALDSLIDPAKAGEAAVVGAVVYLGVQVVKEAGATARAWIEDRGRTRRAELGRPDTDDGEPTTP
jgi:hypothetical protein